MVRAVHAHAPRPLSPSCLLAANTYANISRVHHRIVKDARDGLYRCGSPPRTYPAMHTSASIPQARKIWAHSHITRCRSRCYATKTTCRRTCVEEILRWRTKSYQCVCHRERKESASSLLWRYGHRGHGLVMSLFGNEQTCSFLLGYSMQLWRKQSVAFTPAGRDDAGGIIHISNVRIHNMAILR